MPADEILTPPMAADQHRRALAEEIEALYRDFIEKKGTDPGAEAWNEFCDACEAALPTILAALRQDTPAKIASLIEEVREQAFRRDLADKVLASERERWMRASKKAMAGDLRPLTRQIALIENPPRIVASGSASRALTQEGRSDG